MGVDRSITGNIIANPLLWLLTRTAARGAQGVIWAATDSSLAGVTGKLFSSMEVIQIPNTQTWLWERLFDLLKSHLSLPDWVVSSEQQFTHNDHNVFVTTFCFWLSSWGYPAMEGHGSLSLVWVLEPSQTSILHLDKQMVFLRVRPRFFLSLITSIKA